MCVPLQCNSYEIASLLDVTAPMLVDKNKRGVNLR